MSEVNKLFTIEDFKGTYEFEVEVYGHVTEGGSNRYGSDEPAWIECEITNIYNPKTNKPVSKRLYSVLEKQFGDWFEEILIEEYCYA
jgi:hypothetical protein